MAAELQALVQWVGGTTSLASSRTHSVTVDRPAEKGGSDLGFAGGELFVAGLGGCFMSNLVAAAQARHIKVDSARVNARRVLGGDVQGLLFLFRLHQSPEVNHPVGDHDIDVVIR